jgi:predicted phage terminase large subunit-like protein
MSKRLVTVVRPQPGKQEMFLASHADIAIYGGGAGGGKTWALLMEALRHTRNRNFGAVIFRRTSPQITNEGALWDEASRMYMPIGAAPRIGDLEYRFPSGASVGFGHLQHETTKYDWQGSQIALIGYDELTHFTASQFWYLLSRNRSTCGVRPYIRATCNPDPDSWVAELIAWWIDQETGYPIPDRAGLVRYFVRVGDRLVWADSIAELPQGPDFEPKSVTFIPALLTDNPALMMADPGYRASLLAMPRVERERLLGGNWKIRAGAGAYFQRAWCRLIDVPPQSYKQLCRGWDPAATEKTEMNDPDWTAGTKIGQTPEGRFVVLDHVFDRQAPHGVEMMIRRTAELDGRICAISIPQDAGASGKAMVHTYTKLLAGFNARFSTESTANIIDPKPTMQLQSAKVKRFIPFSAAAQGGIVDVLRAPWNERWFSTLEALPDGRHDDDVDSTSRAFNFLTASPEPVRAAQINFMGR